MKIDPKSYTLDALEREMIRNALSAYGDSLDRVILRKRASPNKSAFEVDSLERNRAMVDDLFGALRD